MASSPTVNNPTNAPTKTVAFTSPRQISAVKKRNEKGDSFVNGADYADEGLPLLANEVTIAKAHNPSMRWAPGLIDPLTQAEITALSHMDESSQGSHINYLKKGVVVDVDARLIESDVAEMRKGVFREAYYKDVTEWMHSPFCRRLRESNARLRNTIKISETSYFSKGKDGIILSPTIAQQFRSLYADVERRLKESVDKSKLATPGHKATIDKKLREQGDSFSLDQQISGPGSNVSASFDTGANILTPVGRDVDFIPLLAGPYNKQLYWFDYLDMHSKAFEAWTHNPIAKRICKMITQFVLGKGVKATVITAEVKTGQKEQDPKTGEEYEYVIDLQEKAQELLDDHWAQNNLNIRAKQIFRDLLIFGEQFIRYFDAPWGLKVRALDPSTIWEVVTDPDDAESEFYIHQQYPTKYQWYVDLPIPTIKFIIRQVPVAAYYHMKINTVSGEVRGRSELFAILGWLKRIKEFASDRVIRNKMGNLFVLDVAVEGGDAQVAAAQAQFAQPPTPGSFFIHNKAATLEGVKAEIGSGDVTSDWDMLMVITAVGAGASLEYLGLNSKSSKAGALVGTEPDVKTFEDHQELMESFFLQDAKRCFDRAEEMGKLPRGVKIKVEITYPALAEENRSEKLKDIAFMESMSWISHKRAASMGAKEMQVTTFEYDEEQELITKEDAEAAVKFNAAYAQVIKGEDSKAAAGTSSGSSSGKSASGMGVGQMGGSSGGAGAQSESASGTRKPGWNGADPRHVAESMLREAMNGSLKKKPLNRRRFAQMTPDRMRDQKSMNRHDIVQKGKRAIRGQYNEADVDDKIGIGDMGEVDIDKKKRKKKSREAMEPFKKGDGDKIQDPEVLAIPDREGQPWLKKKKNALTTNPRGKQRGDSKAPRKPAKRPGVDL